MENFYIRDLAKLKRILEDPRVWEHYKMFTGGRVVGARVEMYEHPNGAKIHGKLGRWWVYVHTEYVLSDDMKKPFEYDIALWKLRATPLLARLVKEGALEIKQEEEYESVSA